MASFQDRRAGRDFLVSGAGILVLAALMVLIAVWYVKPRPAVPLPPARCRVTIIPPDMARVALAPIHFSLPSRIGFSRTVHPGQPRLATPLSPRPEDVRYLPREPKPESPPPAAERPALPLFKPWREETPVFVPIAGPAAGTVTIEPLEGPEVVLPAGFSASEKLAGSGSWSVVARLAAGADGRVEHVFLMPPVPAPPVAARVVGVLRQARLAESGGREARVRIGRLDSGTGGNREGTKP